jgi:hypothetical protein
MVPFEFLKGTAGFTGTTSAAQDLCKQKSPGDLLHGVGEAIRRVRERMYGVGQNRSDGQRARHLSRNGSHLDARPLSSPKSEACPPCQHLV